jgi:hypothetical protein
MSLVACQWTLLPGQSVTNVFIAVLPAAWPREDRCGGDEMNPRTPAVHQVLIIRIIRLESYVWCRTDFKWRRGG